MIKFKPSNLAPLQESAVRQYVWNGTWLESRPLAKSRRLSERAARLEEELPEIFAHWGAQADFFGLYGTCFLLLFL